MKIKYIFFDIDDTLFDSKKLAESARKNAIKAMIKAGLRAKNVSSAYKKLKKIVKKFGPNYEKHFNILLKEYKIKKNLRAKIIAAGIIAYHNTKFKKIKPFPSVKNTFKKLRKKGHRLGIISNGRAVKQWDKLIRLGLQDFFEIIVISEEVGFKKPNLKIFKIALKKAKCKPQNVVMIGDKKKDFAAKKVGMYIIDIRKIKKFSGILKKVGEIEKKNK